MASPASTAFLAAWRNYTARKGHCLVKVALTSPSTYTLRLAGREIATPDGTYELALADVGPVVADGDFCTSDISLCTFSFVMLDRRLSGQTSGTSLSLFASYVWHGATVTVYLWEESLTSFSDALQIFSGQVIDCWVDGLKATVRCRQSTTALLELPTNPIARDTDPRAPEASMGLPRGGILYGSLLSPPAREPASAYGAFQQGITSCFGGQRAVRGVVTRVGRGNGQEKGRVLFASHACKTFNSDVAGATPFIEAGNRLCEIDPIGGDVLNSAADGTGFNIADITSGGTYPFDQFSPVPPAEVALVAANNGESPRSAMDTIADFHYTLLDYDAGQREVTWRLPSLPPMGKAVEYRWVICYKTSAGAANCRVEMGKDAVGSSVMIVAASTTPTAQSATLGSSTYYPTDPFDFTANYIRAYFNGVATGEKLYVYAVAAVVKGFPNGDVVIPGRVVYGPTESRKFSRQGGRPVAGKATQIPDVVRFNFQGGFYATLEGYADDGSGTYTGVADALIELAPDVLRHLLITYCGQSGGDITTAGSTFGSFVDARAQLVTWRGSNMKLAAAITGFRQSSDIIEDMMRGALCWAYISRFDNKWKCVPWKAGTAVNYDYKLALDRRDIVDPEGPQLRQGIEHVENNLEVAYSWDDWQRRHTMSTLVGPTRSQVGHLYRNLRDENVTVVASASDRLDFTDGFGAHTVNLTPAEYDPPIELAQHLTTLMNAASTDDYLNGWGATIVAGYNDKLDINDGGVQQATIAAGAYATMEALAVAVAAALAAIPSANWSCAYSRTTRKFTIARSAGTCTLLCNSGAGRLTSAYSTLGFACTTDKTAAASYVGTYEREEERFFLQCLTNNLDLNCETGANGVNAATPRHCSALLGIDAVRDLTGGVESHLAHAPKNNRETRLTTSAARYGKKRLLKIELPYVNDTDTAREIRNRLVDLYAVPRPNVFFRSERMPDLERGRVIEFSSDFDVLKPYTGIGSDGSWGSKKFQVVRVIQNCGPVFETEVEATEISAA